MYRQVYIPYSALLGGPNSHTVPQGGQKSHTVPQGGQVSYRNKQTCFCSSRVPSDAYCHSHMHRSVPSSYVTAWSRKYLLTGASTLVNNYYIHPALRLYLYTLPSISYTPYLYHGAQ